MMNASEDISVKHEFYIGVFLLFISGYFLFSSITPGHNWGGDFAAYMHQGKALANGSLDHLRMLVQHRIESSTDEFVIGPDFYPWGFPALLAIVISVFGESLFAMKALIVCFVLGIQVVTFYLLRGRAPLIICFSIAFAFGMNSFVFGFKDSILSDLPFTFFSLLTLLLCQRFLLEKRNPSILNLLSLGLAMTAAFSIRTQAIALLPTVALLQLIGRTDFKMHPSPLALFGGLKQVRVRDFIPYAVFAVSVSAVTAILSNPIESYSGTGQIYSGPGFFEKTLHSISRGLEYYGVLPKQLFQASSFIYVFVIVPLLVVGVVRGATKNTDLLIFVVFNMLVLLVFPGRQGLRFILPLIPFLFFFLIIGASEVAKLLRFRKSRALSEKTVGTVLAIVLAVAICGPTLAVSVQNQFADNDTVIEPGPYMTDSAEVFEYIKNYTKKDESIVFWKPRVLTYYTDRKSAFNVRLEDLIGGDHQYVLAYTGEDGSDVMGRSLLETILFNPKNFRPIYENSNFVLYEIAELGAR